MEKDIYLKDYLVSRILAYGKEVPGYGRVYYRTNEDLDTIYRDLDFHKKKVLSVLASSDQVFTARYLGAEQVDSFDKNRLTIYYYYLRKWAIKYRSQLFPRVLGKCGNWLKTLVEVVKPESEEEAKALEFYKRHVKENTKFYNMFYEDHLDDEKGKTIYRVASELKPTIDMPMQFVDFDMFGENKIEDTYDIVLASNILEWARGDKGKFTIARENLKKILNPGGQVVCSSLINRSESTVLSERRIFDEAFTCTEYTGGYVYNKK